MQIDLCIPIYIKGYIVLGENLGYGQVTVLFINNWSLFCVFNYGQQNTFSV